MKKTKKKPFVVERESLRTLVELPRAALSQLGAGGGWTQTSMTNTQQDAPTT